MTPDYAEIFAHRGWSYHAAMQAFPHSRDVEFEQLFAGHPLRRHERLIDIPAGGGYLAKYLGPRAEVDSMEITSGFAPDVTIFDPNAPPPPASYERAVCLAALHHFQDALGFLAKLRDTLKPNGIIHVADVAEGSSLCSFLDDFVGSYNITGHDGRYLPREPTAYAPLGRVTRHDEIACPWSFPDETSMLDFCTNLFGLVDCPPKALRDALGDLVGIRKSNAAVLLEWRLLYIDIMNIQP